MTHQYKVGDKVRALVDGRDISRGKIYQVILVLSDRVMVVDDVGEENNVLNYEFEPVETPKTWGDMTDAERAPILLAWARGEAIECRYCEGEWAAPATDPLNWYAREYRRKPAPVVEVVRRAVFIHGAAHHIEFTITEGKETAVDLVEWKRKDTQ